MNSIKNLFVVIMLMGVSYGAYQVISTPGAGEQIGEPMEDIFPAPPSTTPPLLAKAPENSRNAAIPDSAIEPPFAELEVPKVPMPSPEPTPIIPNSDPFALQPPPHLLPSKVGHLHQIQITKRSLHRNSLHRKSLNPKSLHR